MQAIAAGYRRSLSAPVVAITGSVGKTTTRQMVSACLQSTLQVHQTAGNLNNEIGLPQTLLQAEPEDQAIVLEMGMRGPGEIALLSQIARPDIGLITGIGWSHIGRLGSQSAILSAKSEILTGMRPDQLLILNGDDPLLLGLGRSLAGRQRLAYVSAGDDPVAETLLASAGGEFVLRASSIQTTATDVSFDAVSHVPGLAPKAIPVHLPFPGRHHVRNALFGLAVAHALGIASEQAAAGAAACQNSGNRQHLIQVGSITLMDDTYNAAPESMQAALETLAGLAGTARRKLAAIGCMLELGDYAPEAHRQVGELVARLGYELLLVIGPQAEDLLDGARSVRPDLPSCVCSDLDDMTRRLLATLQPGDHLLVKGSRAFAMEQVSSEIVRAAEQRDRPDENHMREEA
jgi:UDP-N-acetylmuramoyl-tripeptide--D-alanyl-D-alanine ligase